VDGAHLPARARRSRPAPRARRVQRAADARLHPDPQGARPGQGHREPHRCPGRRRLRDPAPVHPLRPGQPGQGPRRAASTLVIVVGTGLAGARPPPRSASSATTSPASASRTPRAAPTRSPPRAASTPPRTTRTTATASTACSTTRQGRRLPRPRGQRLPPGRGQSVEHHRPVRGPGRALRPRVRRPARQPLLRRRPGLPHLLRPRPDRPAAPARRLPGAERQIGLGNVEMFTTAPRCSTSSSSTAARGIVVRDLVTGEIETARRRRGRAGHRRLRQRLLPLHQRHGLQRHGAWRAHKRALLRQPLLHADPPDLHPGVRAATTSRSSR
jgi:hypothetical protein